MPLPHHRRIQQLQRAVIETLEARWLLAGNGLMAQFYNTTDLTGAPITRVDANVNFNWGIGAPDNQLNPDNYTARWTGKVQANYSQTYTFTVDVTGGARLWVNNVQIINQWTATGTNSFTGTIALTAGTKYDIKLEYAEKTGNAAVSLSWQSASQAKQIIPQSAFYSFSETDASAKTNGTSSYNATTGALTIQGGNKTQDWMIPYYFSVQGHMVYQQLAGDCEIIARITARDANAFAGIFIADSFAWGANSINLAVQNSGNLYGSLIGSTGSNSHGNVTLPYWMKLVRLGNTLTAYASADGKAWTVVGSGGEVAIGSTAYVGLGVAGNDSTSTGLVSATFDNITIRSLKLDYATSWVGNSGSGVSAKHVQNDIKSMFVATDGTVFVNSPYDEGGYEVAAYRNGEILGGFSDLHGWGRSGGFAITADANYVYVAMTQGNPGWEDPANFPPSGSTWNCVRKYSRSTYQPVAITGGAGSDKTMLIVNTNTGTIRGMWLIGTELFVATKEDSLVKVYSTTNMSLLRQFSVPNPQQITADASGNLWILSQPSWGSSSILCYSKTGVLQSKSITDVPYATSVYFNPASGQLLVADDGPSQQIIKYNISGATPVRVGTLGEYGGVSAGTPGVVTSTKFDNPMSVAADISGNIYVGFDGISPKYPSAIGTGLVLRSFSSAGALNWELRGLEFVDNGVFDPTSDGTVLYTKDEKWALNLDATSGELGTWVSRTVDELVYPGDGRVTGSDTNVWMRVINGKKFLFASGQSGGTLNIYQQVEGTELWKLCGAVGATDVARDLNNDGTLQDNEWQATNAKSLYVYSAHGADVDANGNVWFPAFYDGIWKATFLGLDANGAPIYSPTLTKSTVSTPFINIGRMVYVAETDTMYIAGFTNANPSNGWQDERAAGSELIRYNNWSTSPTQAWRIVLPHPATQQEAWNGKAVTGLVVAGNRVFAGVVFDGSCYAYDTATGQLVSILYRGPEIGGIGGWLDQVQAVSATRRSNGEYLIASEDDLLSKVIIFRAGGITPTNFLATPGTTGQVTLSWDNNNTRESGYVIQQSTDGVNFTTIATLPANMTSHSISGLATDTRYYFRIKATNSFDDSPWSSLATAFFAVTQAVPTNLTATPGVGQVSLSWLDNATGETAYKVDRSTSPLFASGVTTFTLAANATSYVDTGLSSTVYYYRVYAVNGATNLGYSLTVSTTPLQPIPSAPTGLSAIASGDTQVLLKWTDNSNNEVGFKVERATNAAFTQNLTQILYSTANSTQITDTGLTPGVTYFYRVRASNQTGDSSYTNIASTRTITNMSTYGIFTNATDVGNTGATGSSSYASGSYTLNGAGADIWDTSDAFQYLYRSVSGDFTLVARIDSQTNTTEWAKAGIMVRASTAANSPYLLFGTNGNSASFLQWRTSTGAAAQDSGVALPALFRPSWLKLVRSGNTFTAYYSSNNGVSWTKAGSSITIANMGSTPLVGLAQSSHITGTLGTTVFSNVAFAAAAAPTGLTLAASTDTGTVGDNITSRDNSNPSNILSFNVTGTVSGATVYLYANGYLIGSAVAAGTTTTVSTDGSTALTAGTYSFTAQQLVPGLAPSALSPARSITIQLAVTAAPTAVTLAAASDTGASNSDNLTNLNNSSGKTLSFNVTGTVAGATVYLYADGNLIGQAVANGSTTLVTTNGTTNLSDGSHSFTARQQNGSAALSNATGAATVGIDTVAPRVTGVLASSTAWAASLLTYLNANGLGTGGYQLSGSNQSRTLPWNNVNQLKINFSEDVGVIQSSLSLRGTNVANYLTSGFAYANKQAVWTLAAALGVDRLLADLTDGVTDAAGNALDGEWTTGQTVSSGNGTAGGHLLFRFNSLPGDRDGNGLVLSNDVNAVRMVQFSNTLGVGNYSIFADIDGSGNILSNDVNATRMLQFTALPAALPN